MSIYEASAFWDEHDFSEFDDVQEVKDIKFHLGKICWIASEHICKDPETGTKIKNNRGPLINEWLREKAEASCERHEIQGRNKRSDTGRRRLRPVAKARAIHRQAQGFIRKLTQILKPCEDPHPSQGHGELRSLLVRLRHHGESPISSRFLPANDLTTFLETNRIETRNLFSGNLLCHPGDQNIPIAFRGSDEHKSRYNKTNSFRCVLVESMTSAESYPGRV